MALIRAAKSFRPFAEFSRTLVFNSHREKNVNLIRFRRLLSTTPTTQLASTIHLSNQKLDESVRKLDQDARQMGRLRRSNIEEVLEEILQRKSASSSQSLLLIRCCGSLVSEELPETRTELVQKIWQTVNSLNVPLDVSHYNALLRVYLENEHSFRPTEFLADMESKAVVPNRVTYQRLLSQYCQEGDMGGVSQILEFMREKNISINEQVFNALILGHSQAGDIESAAGILLVMKKSGLEPTSDTYTHLLSAFVKHGKLDEILPTLNKCEASQIYLTDKDLLEIIYQLSTNGHSDFVDNIIPHLRKSSGYNRDAVNAILRLVNKGQEDVAFKLLKTMSRATRPNGELTDTGGFFIRQLIKSERPAEKIVSFCRELHQGGYSGRATILAVEMAANSGNLEIAVPLFRELEQNELPIRQHYFWPLLCARRKISPNAMLDVLRVMQSEFGMTASSETLRDYVLPGLQEQSYENIVSMLGNTGVSASNAVTNCVHHALTQGRIEEAATLVSSFQLYYDPSQIRRPLVASLKATNDYRSWVSIVRGVYENLPRRKMFRNGSAASDEQQDDNESQKQSEVVGQLVVDVVTYMRDRKAEVTQNVLSALVEEGLSMSKRHAETVQVRLGPLLTAEISASLDQLTAGELIPVPYELRAPRFKITNASTQYLEKLIRQKAAEGEATNGLQYALLQAHIKANNVKKTEELIEKLSKTDFVIGSGLCSQIIELFCTNNKLDKALALHAEIKSKEPDFVLDDLKTMKICYEFVANDRTDEAVEFLKSNKRAENLNDERSFQVNSQCYRILNLLAEKGRDADVTKVFDALEGNNFIKVSNVLLGPLIKVHLVNNDIGKAISAFELISTKYKCTPLQNELFSKLIKAEDAATLQLLQDLSTKVHGEVNSLYDLAFAFVECGRIRQARQILETPGLRIIPQLFVKASERYHREGKAASLENLVQATKNLRNIDRRVIFECLLMSYCKEESPEKALDLWTQIQEDDVTLTDKFLSTLARFLREKGVKVPFVVPGNDEPKVEISNQKTNGVRKALKADNLNESNKALDRFTSHNLKVKTEIIEKLVLRDQLDDATQYVLKMLETNTYPLPKTFRFYLTKMSDSGNYEALAQLSPRLTADMRQTISLENRLGGAYISAGKSEQFVDRVIKNYTDATTAEELKDLESNFPTSAMLNILDKHPELFPKFEEFAENTAQKGLYRPINMIWINHMENGRLDQADRIMGNYLRQSPYILFRRILHVARDRKDETIALNLLKALADTKVSERALGTAHKCLIDVYCLQQKYDEAMKAVDNAINDVCLENINSTTLLRVKQGLEASGKTFAHKIPDKKKDAVDSSSSSSSSDDDEPPIKK